MEGAPIPLLHPPFPANLVIMNVVSQFTVCDLVAPRPWQYYVSLWTNLQEEKGRQEGVGLPELLCGGGANSAQCHQQLPILGIKHRCTRAGI